MQAVKIIKSAEVVKAVKVVKTVETVKLGITSVLLRDSKGTIVFVVPFDEWENLKKSILLESTQVEKLANTSLNLILREKDSATLTRGDYHVVLTDDLVKQLQAFDLKNLKFFEEVKEFALEAATNLVLDTEGGSTCSANVAL